MRCLNMSDLRKLADELEREWRTSVGDENNFADIQRDTAISNLIGAVREREVKVTQILRDHDAQMNVAEYPEDAHAVLGDTYNALVTLFGYDEAGK